MKIFIHSQTPFSSIPDTVLFLGVNIMLWMMSAFSDNCLQYCLCRIFSRSSFNLRYMICTTASETIPLSIEIVDCMFDRVNPQKKPSTWYKKFTCIFHTTLPSLTTALLVLTSKNINGAFLISIRYLLFLWHKTKYPGVPRVLMQV